MRTPDMEAFAIERHHPPLLRGNFAPEADEWRRTREAGAIEPIGGSSVRAA